MEFARIKRIFLGEPLTNQMAIHERIPKWKALAVLSSDALSSVAYATEEILIPLAGFGAVALGYSLYVAGAIVLLLFIVTASYRQTIDAYPSGGGAYIVAKDNLGTHAGLIAAASLLLDYVLTVSVSVSAGVENIASAFPFLLEHKEVLGAAIIFVIMLLNLRGMSDSASIFAVPTYIFIFSMLTMIAVGAYKFATHQVTPFVPKLGNTLSAVPVFLILRAFASGCTAMTGVEAISNGIAVFRAPSQRNAKITLIWMSVILGFVFMSMTVLCHLYGIVPQEGETAVSLLAHAVFSSSWFYYLIQGATAMILVLAANTSYADFPRLSSLLAKDRFLPRQLASLGDRLVFSNGILGLSVAAISLVVIFRGDTHLLIPLYAIGVFISFTLSQAGMVLHHIREREPGWKTSLLFNLAGAITTFVVLLVLAVTKFAQGAWLVILLIPVLVLFFSRIHNHYLIVGRELSLIGQIPPDHLEPIKHTVIVPISGIHRGVIEALRYAMSISKDVRACYVELDSTATERVQMEWIRWAHEVPFVVLKSPYRSVIQPLLQYIDDVEQTTNGDMITVIIPEFVTSKWRYQVLHNQTAFLIRTALLFKPGKVVTSVRYHLRNT